MLSPERVPLPGALHSVSDLWASFDNGLHTVAGCSPLLHKKAAPLLFRYPLYGITLVGGIAVVLFSQQQAHRFACVFRAPPNSIKRLRLCYSATPTRSGYVSQ
jgi:hypothetical protein